MIRIDENAKLQAKIMGFALLTGFLLVSMTLMPISKAESNNVIQYSPSSMTGSASTSGDTVFHLSGSGVVNYAYLLFNFSDFSSDKTAYAAVLNIETASVESGCYITAFYLIGSSGSDVGSLTSNIGTNGNFIHSNYVSTFNTWLQYGSSSFGNDVSQACKEKGVVLVMLKLGTQGIDQYGLVAFQDNMHLDVSYNTVSNTPTPTQAPTQPPINNSNPTPLAPEFPTIAVLAIFLVLSLFAVTMLTIRKRKISKEL